MRCAIECDVSAGDVAKEVVRGIPMRNCRHAKKLMSVRARIAFGAPFKNMQRAGLLRYSDLMIKARQLT